MDLAWLDDFLALATSQSFSRAAQQRHITQPAFSRRIRMLEDWVGTPLFERQPRQTTLTPAGEEFRPYAEATTRDLRQARSVALDAAGRASNALTIAATHALSFTFLPPWARSTLDADSLGALSLLSDTMAACEDMMLRGEAQFLVCHAHPADPGRLAGRQFRQHRVGQDQLVPCVAPDDQGQPRWSLDKALPSDLPFLAYGPQSGLGRILTADWTARGIAMPPAPVLSARLAAALLTFAEDARGVAWLPHSLAADSLRMGRLVLASEAAHWRTPVDIVLYRPASRLTPLGEALWSNVVRT